MSLASSLSSVTPIILIDPNRVVLGGGSTEQHMVIVDHHGLLNVSLSETTEENGRFSVRVVSSTAAAVWSHSTGWVDEN